MTKGTWLYAVIGDAPMSGTTGPSQLSARGAPCLLTGLCGVSGERVRSIPCDGLAAVVGTVDLDDYGEEPLRRSFTDPDFVARIARTHHEVIAAVADAGPAVPFRLATIYLGDDRVKTFVASRRDALDATLDRVAGRAEWGVKAYLPAAEDPAAVSEAGAVEAPGRAYLLRRRQQLGRHEAAWARAVACGDEIHAALSAVAAAAQRNPVPADQRPGGELLVLTAAYLVGTAAADGFLDRLQTLSTAGAARLEVTGPWPAYSFADPGELGDTTGR